VAIDQGKRASDPDPYKGGNSKDDNGAKKSDIVSNNGVVKYGMDPSLRVSGHKGSSVVERAMSRFGTSCVGLDSPSLWTASRIFSSIYPPISI